MPPADGSGTAVMMEPIEYTLRKRLPRKLPKRRNDVYVNMKTDFRAQLACCQKLLEGGGHREICVHGLGLAISCRPVARGHYSWQPTRLQWSCWTIWSLRTRTRRGNPWRAPGITLLFISKCSTQTHSDPKHNYRP